MSCTPAKTRPGDPSGRLLPRRASPWPGRSRRPPAPTQAAAEKAAPKAEPRPPRPRPEGFTLRGVVRDAAGRPVAKAWVGSDPRPNHGYLGHPAAGPHPRGGRAVSRREGRSRPAGRSRQIFRDPRRPGSVDDGPSRRHPPGVPGRRSAATAGPCPSRRSPRPEPLHGPRRPGRLVDGRPRPSRGTRSVPMRRGVSHDRWQSSVPRGSTSPRPIIRNKRYTPSGGSDLDRPDRHLAPADPAGAGTGGRDAPRRSEGDLNWVVYPVDESREGRRADWLRWVHPEHQLARPAAREAALGGPAAGGSIQAPSLLGSPSSGSSTSMCPPGSARSTCPTFRVESLASDRMVGKPAAEIDAVDLDGKAVRLADYRGKLIVLDFLGTWSSSVSVRCRTCQGAEAVRKAGPWNSWPCTTPRTASPEDYRRAFAPLPSRSSAVPTCRSASCSTGPPAGKTTRPIFDASGVPRRSRSGCCGAGRTADTYEVSTLALDVPHPTDGTLAGRYHSWDLCRPPGGPVRPAALGRPQATDAARTGRR